MNERCSEFCKDHSMCVSRIEALEKKADKCELELEKYKSYNEGKMDKFSSDMRELSKEFTKKLEESVKEIKLLIDAKEATKDGKVWILVGTIISPVIVIILQKLVENFIK